ncbi:Beta arrestin [Fasciolopsis buskii]|uniref:Beta arrestin n=1 Tax=Fasciolopsis buskii TaxID=27845 RepID=A0A8E0RL01_9TREM|nr:Beta arrestin [Fasciolopsis buski]
MSTKRSVYKKNSASNKLAVYLCARDIFDDLQTVDPIEGVVTLDRDLLRESKVFARIRCTFRYGEQALDDVLAGVSFFKEFFIETIQVYPVEKSNRFEPNEVQNRLMQRFGDAAFPFSFKLPHDIPVSIALQSEQSSLPEEQPRGIEYMLQVFVGNSPNSNVSKRNSIALGIRRLTLATPDPSNGPYTRDLVKVFHFHSGELRIKAVLPKEIFYHGETIPIDVHVDNPSSNTVRRIKFQVVQTVEITLFKQRTARIIITEQELEDGFPINAHTADWHQKFTLRPSLQNTRSQPGLALDGKLKHEDTTLASSTLVKDFRKKEALGIIVQYSIRLKVVTGFGGRDVELDIPFTLTHKRTQQEVVRAETTSELVIEKFKRQKSKRREDSQDE